MVATKASPLDFKFDFEKDLADTPMVEFPMVHNPYALPHEPPKDRVKKTRWIHLFWTEPIPPPSLQGLEETAFVP